MEKVSEILQQGLNQVKDGIVSPYTGMCIIVAYMRGAGKITHRQEEQVVQAIDLARHNQGLLMYAYLTTALRNKHQLDVGGKQVGLLWIKWYEDLIAELQAKGE